MNKITPSGAGMFAGVNRLEAAKAWSFEAPSVERNGKKIVLPNDPAEMPISNAIEHLQRLEKAEETKSTPTEFIKCFPYDGLVAFSKALAHLFGWASAEMVPSMYGPVPPQPISIRVGHRDEDFVVVPMGEFSIPALPKEHRIGVNITRQDNGDFGINIFAKTQRKYENVVRAVAKATMEFLRQDSIYKGKAFRLTTEGTQLDLNTQPQFINALKIRQEDLHLNEDVLGAVTTSIFTPIQHTETCRRLGVPLKRGVLLEGKYGTGKSLISTITARKAVENKWTFITIDDPSALAETLVLAQQYQPCVVFCEDVDRAVTLARDDGANLILNTLDGVLSKNAEVMVVFTTNHVETINKALLRPGRLDSVITIKTPDADTIARLIHYYGRGTVQKDADLTRVCASLEGQIPATIREVVERAKLVTIPRCVEVNGFVEITEHDLYVTAETMQNHLRLLNTDPADNRTPAESLLNQLGGYLVNGGVTVQDIHKSGATVTQSIAGMMGDLRNLTLEVKRVAASAHSAASNNVELTQHVHEKLDGNEKSLVTKTARAVGA